MYKKPVSLMSYSELDVLKKELKHTGAASYQLKWSKDLKGFYKWYCVHSDEHPYYNLEWTESVAYDELPEGYRPNGVFYEEALAHDLKQKCTDQTELLENEIGMLIRFHQNYKVWGLDYVKEGIQKLLKRRAEKNYRSFWDWESFDINKLKAENALNEITKEILARFTLNL